MNEQLKSDMNALADRVAAVDLTDQAGRTARRLRATRSTVAGVAALAVAGSAGLAVMSLPGDPGIPAAESKMDGRIVVQMLPEDDEDPFDAEEYDLATWVPGEEPVEIPLKEPVITGTESVSRDGDLYSYVGEDEAIHVIDLASGEEIPLPSDAPGLHDVPMDDDSAMTAPTWAPDSTRLWLNTGATDDDERYGFVDITDGEFTPTVALPDWWGVKVVSDDDGQDRLRGVAGNGDVTEIRDVDAQGQTDPVVLGSGNDIYEFQTGQFDNINTATADGSRLCLQNSSSGTVNEHADQGTNGCHLTANFDAESGQYELGHHGMSIVDVVEGQHDLTFATSDDTEEWSFRLLDEYGSVVDEVTPHESLERMNTEVIAYDPKP